MRRYLPFHVCPVGWLVCLATLGNSTSHGCRKRQYAVVIKRSRWTARYGSLPFELIWMEFCHWFPLVHGVAVPSEMTNDNNVGQLAVPACLVPAFSFSLSLLFFATQRGGLGFLCLSVPCRREKLIAWLGTVPCPLPHSWGYASHGSVMLGLAMLIKMGRDRSRWVGSC